MCGLFPARDLHFKNLCHRGVIIISKPCEGTDFRDVHFSVCCEQGIINVDMHHLAIDDFDPAVLGLASRPMGGKIATLKCAGLSRTRGPGAEIQDWAVTPAC